MPTFLFDQIIFGPVKSRRLGTSLGINLLPTTRKHCNFNCAYCECGWSDYQASDPLPSEDAVLERLEACLASMKARESLPDVITFAGNGEPTIHPRFAGIVQGTIALRDKLCPGCQVTILTNATMLHKPEIVSALMLADKSFIKIDSAIQDTVQLLNKPLAPVRLDDLSANMRQFGDKLIIQTLLLRGTIEGRAVDNTTDVEIEQLIQFYQEAQPSVVHMYSIARDTPIDTIYPIPAGQMKSIADRVKKNGIEAHVY